VKARLSAFFFLSLMLVKVCIMPLIYLDFELRRDYIVKNLCVNRDRPQLNCDGKCYLAKRIAAAQEKEQQEAEQSFIFKLCETLAEPVSLFGSARVTDFVPPASEKVSFSYSSGLNGRILVSGIFHPPLSV
jgi:hypothetical protein